MNETHRIHRELKRCLRESRLTYVDVAEHLQLSEASVKRLFSRSALSVERLERICELAGVSFSDLVERMETPDDPLTKLTEEQERALVANPKLLLLMYLVLNGAEPFEICETYRVTPSEAQRLLLRLDKLKIIELRPFNRIKLLTARNFDWRKDGPVARLFRERVRDEFLDAGFEQPGETLRFVSGTLSTTAQTQLCRSIDRLVQEFEDVVKQEQSVPRSERTGCSAVLAFRPWETSIFSDLRRK